MTDEFEGMDFGLDDLDLDLDAFADESEAALENRYVKPRRFQHVKERAVKYDNAEALAAEVGTAIMDGERVDALVSGNFIFGDFLEAFAVSQNLKIQSARISTLSISQENVDSLRSLMTHGHIDNLDLIVSDYFWSHNRHNMKYVYDALDIDNRFQLAVAGIHTKTILLNARGRKIIISGSANLRSSRSVEMFTVETEPDLYDFHFEWQSRILDRYATVKKSIRASALFDILTE
mgnify:CR=1 FL=1